MTKYINPEDIEYTNCGCGYPNCNQNCESADGGAPCAHLVAHLGQIENIAAAAVKRITLAQWIIISKTLPHTFECSYCAHCTNNSTPYCPMCGSQMYDIKD